MKDDKIYDLLNDCQMDLDQYEDINLSQEERARAKENFNKSAKNKDIRKGHPIIKTGIAAALVLALSVGVLNTDVRAQIASRLDSVTYSMRDALGITGPGQSYEIGQTARMGDYQVRVNDILMDEDSITLSYLLEGPGLEGPRADAQVENIDLKVNGKRVAIAGAMGEAEMLEAGLQGQLLIYSFKDPIELEESNDVSLSLVDIWKDGDLIRGRASFDFTATKEELAGEALTLAGQTKVDTDLGEIKVNKLILHPYISQIYFQVPWTEAMDQMHIDAIVLTEDGQELSFSGGGHGPNEDGSMLDFHLYSDRLSQPAFEDLVKSGKLYVKFIGYKLRTSDSKDEPGTDRFKDLNEPVELELN